jgi:hypothetical protein
VRYSLDMRIDDNGILINSDWNSKCMFVAHLLDCLDFVGSPISVFSGSGCLHATESVVMLIFAC